MRARVCVGVDVGGTKTAIAGVRFPEGQLLERVQMPTPPRRASGAPFLAEVAVRAAALADQLGATAVGVSVCELVGADGGIDSDHRVLWRGLPITTAFSGRIVVVDADVRAGATAEALFGAGIGFRDVLYVNLGTGISSCWMRAGSPHRGARGHALVLASSPIETVCPACGKGSAFAIEDVAGAAGLVAAYRAAGGTAASAREVFERAAEGDAGAAAVTESAAKMLGACIGFAINILDPEALVMGGGLAAAGGAYGELLETEIRAHIWSMATRALPIRRASLGADSALIGAAALAGDAAAGGRQARAPAPRHDGA
jgi:glucokinase